MATPVVPGQIVQVTPRYLIEGQQCENVMFFECVAEDVDMLANLLLKIATCIITHLLPVLASDVQLESVHGKIVGPAVGLEDEWTPGAEDVVAGAAAGDGLPSYVSAVISLYSTRPGRSGRGRMFIGGLPESGTTLSLLKNEDPLKAGLIAFLACIAASFPLNELGSGPKYQWCVLSRKVAGTPKPPFPTASVARVTRYVVREELGTTRSRKLGRGR